MAQIGIQIGTPELLLASAVVAGLALGWAAVDDVCRRNIPDGVPLLLCALGIAGPLLRDGQWPWDSLALAATVFLILSLPFECGWLGGGDVKLATALVLFLGTGSAAGFALATALAGGVLSLVYLAGWVAARRLRLVRRLLRRFGSRRRSGLRRRLVGLLIEETHRVATRHSVPYGVALAAGGLLTLANLSGGAAWS